MIGSFQVHTELAEQDLRSIRATVNNEVCLKFKSQHKQRAFCCVQAPTKNVKLQIRLQLYKTGNSAPL